MGYFLFIYLQEYGGCFGCVRGVVESFIEHGVVLTSFLCFRYNDQLIKL